MSVASTHEVRNRQGDGIVGIEFGVWFSGFGVEATEGCKAKSSILACRT